MKYAWAVAGCLVLACASAPEQKSQSTAHAAASDVTFPPTGPVELRARKPPADGTLYQLLVSYEGRSEVAEETKVASDPEMVDEKVSLEIDYRQMPVATPTTEELASSLILEALKRRMRLMPPGKEHILEVGDDRIRTTLDDKVEVDLRGAQPKQDLTPRTVLQKPFALVVSDSLNNPKGVTIRGLPAAKKLLVTLPLRESLGYMQIGFPDRPVSPGDTWHAKRFFPNPIGKLGVAVDFEIRLVGFEKVGDAPCAHVSLHSKVEATKVPSELGFTFEEVRYTASGDAWLDLSTGEVAAARIEDVAAVAFHRVNTAIPARLRMRYESRSALQRLDSLPPSEKWADGTKRFSAVK